MDLFNSWLVETPIAYRGMHDKTTPENSLPAYQKAIDNGFAIALSVRMLSDGTIVAFHDDGLARMTGNDGYVKFLKKQDLDMLTLADSNEKIPTLQEVLNFVNGKTPLLIEIKNSGKVGEMEGKVLELLKNYNGKIAIQSFNPYVLEYFYKVAPEIPRGQLAGYFKNQKMPRLQKHALKKMLLNKISHPDFIAYEGKRLPNRFVRKYKQLPLLAWIIRSQDEYLKVVKYCDNIIFEGFEPKI